MIEAKGESIGEGIIEIPFTGDSNFGCEGDSVIEVFNAEAELPNGDLIPIEGIDGGIFFSSFPPLIGYAFGEVFYSDGITRAFGAIVETTKIDGIPAKQTTVFCDAIGTYTQRIEDDILGASATIEIRACFPDTCGICTEPVEIHFVNPGWPDDPTQSEPVHHDFILPIPPPIQNPRSDINQDDKIDAEDLLILLEDWGKTSGG